MMGDVARCYYASHETPPFFEESRAPLPSDRVLARLAIRWPVKQTGCRSREATVAQPVFSDQSIADDRPSPTTLYSSRGLFQSQEEARPNFPIDRCCRGLPEIDLEALLK